MHPSREDSFLQAAVGPRSGRCAPANVMPGVAAMRTACYSAENRMISETDANGTTATYAYDGNGHRDQGVERVDDHLASTQLFSVGSFTWGCAYPEASRKRGASASGIRCDLFGQRDAFFLVLASGVGIPFLSISVAFAIRVSRVSSLLASLIQRQYSLR